MPSYTFRNKETDEVFTTTMTMAEREQYLNDNTNIEQLITYATQYVPAERLGLKRPSSTFQERLKEIKKAHKHSTIETWG